MQKRWNLLKTETEKAAALQQALKIHPSLCGILSIRGIDTFEKAKQFFRPALTDLHSPWLMQDMDKAVERVLKAIEQEEKILLFGDYDVDGTTAVACMFLFLNKVRGNATVEYYIPHRYKEGYGISKAGIDFAIQEHFSLIISLDCGIKSTELIAYAKQHHVDFIVCDHHTPDPILPDAVAILNPKRKDCNYPFKELCGCGVGFKLITALSEKLKLPAEYSYEYLDLVATAIAADIVPMTGENRVLVYHGLLKANSNPNEGIAALKELSGLEKDLHINNLVFMIAPRVNAAGRMDEGGKAVKMFISKNKEEAKHFAELLQSDNLERKEADKIITEEALGILLGDAASSARKSTVVFQSHWHKGVVGIVASRLIDHYYRPTIVLTKSGDYAAGSARSVAGFNVYEAIHECRDLLLGYGGHFYAAGMTLELDKIEAFRARFEEVVSTTIREECLTPEIIIDAEINIMDIRSSFYNIICQMEPFGPENTRPVFLLRNVKDSGYSRIVKESHIRFSVTKNEITINGIGFGMAEKFHLLQVSKEVDIVFTIDENDWNNVKELQLRVIDFKPSANTNGAL
jgi:single-stranded-DNA-specific exonuclease